MQTHLRKRGDAVAEDVTEKNLRELAFDTQRYSGAAIANLVNLAAMRVERDGRDRIAYKDLTDVSSACLLAHASFNHHLFLAILHLQSSVLVLQQKTALAYAFFTSDIGA